MDQVPDIETLTRELGVSISKADYNLICLWEKRRSHILMKTMSAPPDEPPPHWHLQETRGGITHHFTIPDADQPLSCYLTAQLYPTNRLGGLQLIMSKQGTFISGVANALTYLMSIALQYGVPLQDITKKFSRMRFDPSGAVKEAPDPSLHLAQSLLDYLARYLDYRFPGGYQAEEI